MVETVAAVAAGVVIIAPSCVLVITALRTERKVDAVKGVVNGNHAQLVAELETVRAELAESRRRER